MLLTTEVVADEQMAATILRWYYYRWHVEEYHKIFKSGCQVERYRLTADAMKTLIGFLSVIAVELLQLTYLHLGQGTLLGVYRWLILSLIAYILAHWAYLSTHSKDLPN